jgi:phosphoribosylamine--glycine ligase
VKVLVVGNGGREHAIAWKLLQSPTVDFCYCVPGNGGTASLDRCQNVPLTIDDFAGIAQWVQQEGVELVVVGPELPLSLGITDYFQNKGIKVFGPTQAGARLEASKSWAKAVMLAAGVPTAASETFTEAIAAKDYVSRMGAPIVIKADGLAAGKGVIVAQTVAEAHQGIDDLLAAGLTPLVIEEFLVGEEVSILALTDGSTVRSLLPAQDHKRIGEGDTGLNTGGMGAYAPAPIASGDRLQHIETEILQPIIQTLKQQGIDYRGVLYAGLMITASGDPKVLEFNCRFGDPETQAILPLLRSPLDQLLLACVAGRLEDHPPLDWLDGLAICVVMSAAGYPGSYEKGTVIRGIEAAEKLGATVFQAGTRLQNSDLLTDGGRVLGVTAIGEDFVTARDRVYQAIREIHFEGAYYRRDIGHRLDFKPTISDSSHISAM